MSLDFLNSLSTKAVVPEHSEYAVHPLGKFQGIITGINKKTAPKSGKSLWEVRCETTDYSGNHIGVCDVPFWGWSLEMEAAASAPSPRQDGLDARKEMIKSISLLKRLLSDVGVYTKSQAQSLPWSSAEGFGGVLESLGKIKGKKCEVVVKKNNNDPSRVNCYLNPPSTHLAKDDLGAIDGLSEPDLTPPGSNASSVEIPF